MKPVLWILLIAVAFGCNLSYKLSNRLWTPEETKEWSIRYGNYSTWKGIVLYQGTDSAGHHFISRVMDEWVWFRIHTDSIQLSEIQPYQCINPKDKSLGFYYLDPQNRFKRLDSLPSR